MKAEVEEANLKAIAEEPFSQSSRLAIAMERASEPIRGWLSAQIEAILSEIPFREATIQKSMAKEPTSATPPKFLTVEEAGKLLNIPTRWLYRHSKDIPHKRMGKYLRFSEKELLKWAERRHNHSIS